MKILKKLKKLLKNIFNNEGGHNQLLNKNSIEYRKHEMLLKHYHQYPLSILN
tara:strand:+ start:110981 stop:111136 length:156 start_codon:yes stop_codon:yes gene_type:complete